LWHKHIVLKKYDNCSHKDYLNAMVQSSVNSTRLKSLLKNALTDEINCREIFMK